MFVDGSKRDRETVGSHAVFKVSCESCEQACQMMMAWEARYTLSLPKTHADLSSLSIRMLASRVD